MFAGAKRRQIWVKEFFTPYYYLLMKNSGTRYAVLYAVQKIFLINNLLIDYLIINLFFVLDFGQRGKG